MILIYKVLFVAITLGYPIEYVPQVREFENIELAMDFYYAAAEAELHSLVDSVYFDVDTIYTTLP